MSNKAAPGRLATDGGSADKTTVSLHYAPAVGYDATLSQRYRQFPASRRGQLRDTAWTGWPPVSAAPFPTRRPMSAPHPHIESTHLGHDHLFHAPADGAERGTRIVLVITLVTMVVEIVAGWLSGSMALLADGWHMSSHAVAIGLGVVAYATARRYARDPRFAFGTWKVEILGGFASAVLLMAVAGLMVWGSVERLLQPVPIAHREAMAIAALGLLVNAACALILMRAGGGHHHHGHHHGHHHADHHGPACAHDAAHGHEHGHAHAHANHGAPARDLNLHAAYVHVLADALTSVLAIVALAAGWAWGWNWLDPLMGLVGAALVARWALGLIRETGLILIDREMDHPVVDEIRDVLDVPGDPHGTRLTDLHVWRVGQQVYACALTLTTRDTTLTPDEVRRRLSLHEEIVHITAEVHHERG